MTWKQAIGRVPPMVPDDAVFRDTHEAKQPFVTINLGDGAEFYATWPKYLTETQYKVLCQQCDQVKEQMQCSVEAAVPATEFANRYRPQFEEGEGE